VDARLLPKKAEGTAGFDDEMLRHPYLSCSFLAGAALLFIRSAGSASRLLLIVWSILLV
jgi:hypothetical protein